MRKKYLFFFVILLLSMLLACGPMAEEATVVPESNESEAEEGEDVFPRPTITPISQEENVSEPEATAVPDDYPPRPAPVVQPEAAYPSNGESVWVVFPVGVQCEGDGPFSDLDAAVSALADSGVTVTDQGVTELVVATVCGQPTSEHYRVQILSESLPQAEALGWRAETQ